MQTASTLRTPGTNRDAARLFGDAVRLAHDISGDTLEAVRSLIPMALCERESGRHGAAATLLSQGLEFLPAKPRVDQYLPLRVRSARILADSLATLHRTDEAAKILGDTHDWLTIAVGPSDHATLAIANDLKRITNQSQARTGLHIPP